MKHTKLVILVIAIWTFSLTSYAQQPILINSHNDYLQEVPFYEAYSRHIYSIEADIFKGKDNQLQVAHTANNITSNCTFETLYLQPILKAYQLNNNFPWKNHKDKMQLLIDIKSSCKPTINSLVKTLKKHPDVFNNHVNPFAVKVVITGNTPSPDTFSKYPDFIFFDGDLDTQYSDSELKRIAFFSDDFAQYTSWNGKGGLKEPELKKIIRRIHAAHKLHKPIRFWNTPDGVTAWNTLHNIGVDIINTDEPTECAAFFEHRDRKRYSLALENNSADSIARATRLDKETANFKGFNQNKQFLSKGVEVYHPSYTSDGLAKKAKNVILLIGDGMGLAQVCAAYTVNGDLNVFQMKNIGFIKTFARDYYTTDSAAGGSALATGVKTNNRYISANPDGSINPTLCEVLHQDGVKCGVVTTSNIADATPATFYGHTTERDNADEITSWLTHGTLDLLCGSGMDVLTKREDGLDLMAALKKQYLVTTDIDSIDTTQQKTICIAQEFNEGTNAETIDLLKAITTKSINKLNHENQSGFFLMVEGGKIDWAGHANTLPASILENLNFDAAVAAAIQFADEDGETLVVVTADHETGGLSIVDGNTEKHEIVGSYMTHDHTPIMVPIYAYGPGSQNFTGVYQNTQVFDKILECMNDTTK